MRHLTFLALFLMTLIRPECQTFTILDQDIPGVVGLSMSPQGKAIVVSGGTGSNDGRILSYNDNGDMQVVVNGLPSFFNVELQELQSAFNVYFLDLFRFYVVIGNGPGSDFGSLALFDIRDRKSKGVPLTLEDAQNIIHVSNWVLGQGYPESNPYSILSTDNGDLLIADAAANAIIKYSKDQSFSVLADLPSTPNPLPFGPPFIEPVPTKILASSKSGYLVSCLTGFPFASGESNIYHITDDGVVSTYSSGLTVVTDMVFDPYDGNLIALQFANFGQMGFEFGSAQMIKIHEDGEKDVMARGFGPSAGFDIDQNGTIYATHLFLGQLLKWQRFDGCHEPLNVKSVRQDGDTYTVSWNRVEEAEGYEMLIGYDGIEGSFTSVPLRRNRVTITSPSKRKILLKVRTNCGNQNSEYSREVILDFSDSNTYISGNRSKHNDGQEIILDEPLTSHFFPNPVSDYLNVPINLSHQPDLIEVYNLNGMKMLSTSANMHQSIQELDVSSFPEGTYMVATFSDGIALERQPIVIIR